MGRHNHSSEHDRKRNRGHDRRSNNKRGSKIDRLRAINDPQGLGWSGA